MGRWMPTGMPNVDAFALLMRVDATVPPVLIAGAVDPEAAGADPEGPAAAEVVGAEAFCRDDISVAEEQSATVLYSAGL